jgi:hypothetical protein
MSEGEIYFQLYIVSWVRDWIARTHFGAVHINSRDQIVYISRDVCLKLCGLVRFMYVTLKIC